MPPVHDDLAEYVAALESGWSAAPIGAIIFGVALLAAPSQLEGPVLLAVSPGHAISVLDAVGLIPLLAGTFCLYVGLWRRRARLSAFALEAPGVAGVAVLTCGFGLGLLIASAFSSFFGWWAIGAVLFAGALAGAVLAASRRNGPPRS